MKKLITTSIILSFLVTCLFAANRNGIKVKPRLLIFFLTKGYKHKSIEDGIKAIQKLGSENNFSVDTTTSPTLFTEEELSRYKTIIFLSPTGDDFFTEQQKRALQKFIHKGGGFVGIHAATDCLFNWEWYGRMIGAYFTKHPPTQEAKLLIKDRTHPATGHLPATWLHTDEWYNFKSFNDKVTVLIELDESSYQGGEMGAFHPISWYHNFEGGRVFYTGLGHTPESYKEDDIFLKHLLGGIEYAMGAK